MRIAIALISLFMTFAAHAASDCTFIPRRAMSDLLRAYSTELVGQITCYEHHPELGSFKIARFKQGDETRVDQFMNTTSHLIMFSTTNSTILKDEHSASGQREIWMRSARLNGNEAFMHYGFTVKASDGSTILIMYSAPETEIKGQRALLKKLKLNFTQTEFLNSILADAAP